jgi:hypothetical protein
MSFQPQLETATNKAVNRSGEIGRIYNGQSFVAARLRQPFVLRFGFRRTRTQRSGTQ